MAADPSVKATPTLESSSNDSGEEEGSSSPLQSPPAQLPVADAEEDLAQYNNQEAYSPVGGYAQSRDSLKSTADFQTPTEQFPTLTDLDSPNELLEPFTQQPPQAKPDDDDSSFHLSQVDTENQKRLLDNVRTKAKVKEFWSKGVQKTKVYELSTMKAPKTTKITKKKPMHKAPSREAFDKFHGKTRPQKDKLASLMQGLRDQDESKPQRTNEVLPEELDEEAMLNAVNWKAGLSRKEKLASLSQVLKKMEDDSSDALLSQAAQGLSIVDKENEAESEADEESEDEDLDDGMEVCDVEADGSPVFRTRTQKHKTSNEDNKDEEQEPADDENDEEEKHSQTQSKDTPKPSETEPLPEQVINTPEPSKTEPMPEQVPNNKQGHEPGQSADELEEKEPALQFKDTELDDIEIPPDPERDEVVKSSSRFTLTKLRAMTEEERNFFKLGKRGDSVGLPELCMATSETAFT